MPSMRASVSSRWGAPADLSGHLDKLSRTDGRWRRRFFVLSGQRLIFLRSAAPSARPLGVLHLAGARISTAADDDDEGSSSSSSSHSDPRWVLRLALREPPQLAGGQQGASRRMRLAAPSRELQELWRDALRQAAAAPQMQQQLPDPPAGQLTARASLPQQQQAAARLSARQSGLQLAPQQAPASVQPQPRTSARRSSTHGPAAAAARGSSAACLSQGRLSTSAPVDDGEHLRRSMASGQRSSSLSRPMPLLEEQQQLVMAGRTSEAMSGRRSSSATRAMHLQQPTSRSSSLMRAAPPVYRSTLGSSGSSSSGRSSMTDSSSDCSSRSRSSRSDSITTTSSASRRSAASSSRRQRGLGYWCCLLVSTLSSDEGSDSCDSDVSMELSEAVRDRGTQTSSAGRASVTGRSRPSLQANSTSTRRSTSEPPRQQYQQQQELLQSQQPQQPVRRSTSSRQGSLAGADSGWERAARPPVGSRRSAAPHEMQLHEVQLHMQGASSSRGPSLATWGARDSSAQGLQHVLEAPRVSAGPRRSMAQQQPHAMHCSSSSSPDNPRTSSTRLLRSEVGSSLHQPSESLVDSVWWQQQQPPRLSQQQPLQRHSQLQHEGRQEPWGSAAGDAADPYQAAPQNPGRRSHGGSYAQQQEHEQEPPPSQQQQQQHLMDADTDAAVGSSLPWGSGAGSSSGGGGGGPRLSGPASLGRELSLPPASPQAGARRTASSRGHSNMWGSGVGGDTEAAQHRHSGTISSAGGRRAGGTRSQVMVVDAAGGSPQQDSGMQWQQQLEPAQAATAAEWWAARRSTSSEELSSDAGAAASMAAAAAAAADSHSSALLVEVPWAHAAGSVAQGEPLWRHARTSSASSVASGPGGLLRGHASELSAYDEVSRQLRQQALSQVRSSATAQLRQPAASLQRASSAAVQHQQEAAPPSTGLRPQRQAAPPPPPPPPPSAGQLLLHARAQLKPTTAAPPAAPAASPTAVRSSLQVAAPHPPSQAQQAQQQHVSEHLSAAVAAAASGREELLAAILNGKRLRHVHRASLALAQAAGMLQ